VEGHLKLKGVTPIKVSFGRSEKGGGAFKIKGSNTIKWCMSCACWWRDI